MCCVMHSVTKSVLGIELHLGDEDRYIVAEPAICMQVVYMYDICGSPE